MKSGRLTIIQGDITTISTDAIVNAANSSLLGGGGVDGAIHRAGGPAILEECRAIGGCKTGDAVTTTAGNLPAKYVIHTVGPVWHGGSQNEDELLKNCYLNSLNEAVRHSCKSVAFPNISTGVYHFPKERAAKIALTTIRTFLENERSISHVEVVCFDTESYNILNGVLMNL